MKVHEAIASHLADNGVNTCFGVLGEANMYLVHDLVTDHGVRYVAAAREDGAVLMADAYTRLSGTTGLASVTQGPGLTNTITALREAVRNGTPMVLVTGDTPAAHRDHVQQVDQRDLVRATGADFHVVRSADTAVTDVALALRAARTHSRPVVVDLPSDLQHAPAGSVEAHVQDPPPASGIPDAVALDRAVGVLASATRPLVLVGRGAVGARERVLRVAERLGAPIGTTLLAKDLFRGHPHDLGVVGTLASEVAGRALEHADCVLAIGASLNSFTTASGALLGTTPVVHVDRVAEHIGRWHPVAAGVVGDADDVLDAVDRLLGEADVRPSRGWDTLLEDLPSYPLGRDVDDHSTDHTVDIRTFARRVDELLPERRVIVTDGGRSVIAPMLQLRVPDPRDFVFTLNFAAVGLGLGAAVGAAMARPDVPTVLVTGDGGLMMSLSEFSTAVRHDLDLVVLVMNDASYGAEYHNLLRAGMEPGLSMFDWPALAPVAESLGGIGVTVRCLDDIGAAMKAVAQRDRPVLVDVHVDVAVRTGFYD